MMEYIGGVVPTLTNDTPPHFQQLIMRFLCVLEMMQKMQIFVAFRERIQVLGERIGGGGRRGGEEEE